MKRLIILILLVLLLLPLHSQNFTKIKYDRHVTGYKSADNRVYTVQIDCPASGMVLAIDKADIYKGSYIVIDGDTTLLAIDDENDGNVDHLFSNLISFSTPVDSFLFYPAGINHEITFYYIDARMKKPIKKQAEIKKKSVGCSVPDMIEQSAWRVGLPAPEYDRINQKVMNVIIHHTAGSNTDVNYTEIVRNIYVYHTQIRGWSDIGYNYLIAPDGLIYKGRDPDEYEQDNVMGAHFCASNSGTMGISIMGTFTDIVPSDTALHSLLALLSWKLFKEDLDPLGFSNHPLNSELSTIAGHRDGCATECPGNALYMLLDNIRIEVKEKIDKCNDPSIDGNEGIKIYYDKNIIKLYCKGSGIETISVFDLFGRKIPLDIDFESIHTASISLNHGYKGIFILVCKTINTEFTEKIFIYQ